MMPTITINVAPGGSELTSGGSSFTGHAWITDNDGNSWGFGPEDGKGSGNAYANDNIWKDDDNRYLQDDQIEMDVNLTEEQYEKLEAFVNNPEAHGFDLDYNLVFNNCTDFVWEALEAAELPVEVKNSLEDTPDANINNYKMLAEKVNQENGSTNSNHSGSSNYSSNSGGSYSSGASYSQSDWYSSDGGDSYGWSESSWASSSGSSAVGVVTSSSWLS